MSDINLLPKDLREGEARERGAERPAPRPEPQYSVPVGSQLGDRLQSLTVDRHSGWWQRMKQWFMKPPSPPPVVPIPLEKPGTKKPMSSFKLVKPEPKATFVPVGLKGKPQPAAAVPPPRPVPAPVRVKGLEAVPPIPAMEAEIPPAEPPVPIGVVLDVNLLPVESRPEELTEGVGTKFGVVAAVAVVVVGVGYLILTLMASRQADQVAQTRQAATQLAAQIDTFRPTLAQVEAAGQKVRAIRQLLQSRHNWLTFFSQLELLTLPTVRFGNLTLGGDGAISMNAESLTLGDLARQLKVFQNASNVFSDVKVGNFSSTGQSGSQGVALFHTSFQLQLASGWEQAAASPVPATPESVLPAPASP